MGDPDEQAKPSPLRFVLKELAILALGLVVMFVAFGLALVAIARLLGWSMCCQ